MCHDPALPLVPAAPPGLDQPVHDDQHLNPAVPPARPAPGAEAHADYAHYRFVTDSFHRSGFLQAFARELRRAAPYVQPLTTDFAGCETPDTDYNRDYPTIDNASSRCYGEDGLPRLRLSDFDTDCCIRPFALLVIQECRRPSREEDIIIRIFDCIADDIEDEPTLIRIQNTTMDAISSLIHEGLAIVTRPDRPGHPGSRLIWIAD